MRRSWAGLAVVVLVAAGLAAVFFGLSSPAKIVPPQPSARGVAHAPVVPHDGEVHQAAASARSQPTTLSIPALKIATALGPPRGLTSEGTIDDAPLSGPDWALPWWYDGGPSPGQHGSAVLLGHVDSAIGSGHLGAFFSLGKAQRGDKATVTLADHVVTRWSVRSVVLYPDARFPDATVYARTGSPTLRLVTCGGRFDPTTHLYQSVVVVTAVLTHSS